METDKSDIKETKKPDKVSKRLRKKAIVASISKNASVTLAVDAAGINRDTYYEWLKKDPKFAEAIERAKLDRITVVEDAMFINATVNKNVTAQIFLLCNLASHKYQNVNKVIHTGLPKRAPSENFIAILNTVDPTTGRKIGEIIQDAVERKKAIPAKLIAPEPE